jgi:hypothetical protein
MLCYLFTKEPSDVVVSVVRVEKQTFLDRAR